ncbi:MAG: Uma2 family endonuclease [Chloroflexota bacterium]
MTAYTDSIGQPISAEALTRLPEADGRHELERGRLLTFPFRSPRHGIASLRIACSLFAHVTTSGLGKVYPSGTGYQLTWDPDTVRVPSVSFLSAQRQAEQTPLHSYIQGAPDLAVEITAPPDGFGKVLSRALMWLHHGSPMVLVVDPAAQLAARLRSRGDVRVTGPSEPFGGEDIVPGWSMTFGESFDQALLSPPRRVRRRPC